MRKLWIIIHCRSASWSYCKHSSQTLDVKVELIWSRLPLLLFKHKSGHKAMLLRSIDTVNLIAGYTIITALYFFFGQKCEFIAKASLNNKAAIMYFVILYVHRRF